jgi:hypothetical protein
MAKHGRRLRSARPEDPTCAAIGSLLSAEVYGLVVVAAGSRIGATTAPLRGNRGGSARALGPRPDLDRVHDRRDEAGALFRLIEPFAREGVNLTSIQLRPIKGKPWEYLFFIDCEGTAPRRRCTARSRAPRAWRTRRASGLVPAAGGRSADRRRS